MNTQLLLCRPGFENEVCAELSEHVARRWAWRTGFIALPGRTASVRSSLRRLEKGER